MVGIIVTVGLGILAYLVSGLIGWGKASAALEANTLITTSMRKELSDLRAEMLRPVDLKLAVSEMERTLSNVYATKSELAQLEKNIAHIYLTKEYGGIDRRNKSDQSL